MDIDPLSAVESDDDEPESGKRSRLNPAVAVAVAVLASILAICKVKDDNIVQAMQKAQADMIDHWSYFQARNLREELARATLTQLRLQAADRPAERQSAYAQEIERYEQIVKDQSQKKELLRLQAVKDEETYNALNYRDDQFDLSDALIAIAISLLAIASLTQLWWLFGLAMVPAGFGVVMGLAGLVGWDLHPTALIRLLS